MKVEIYVRPKLVEYMPTTKLEDFKTKKYKTKVKNPSCQNNILHLIFRISEFYISETII